MTVRVKKIGQIILHSILFFFLPLIENQRAFSFPISGLKIAQSSNINSTQIAQAACNNPSAYGKVTKERGLEVYSRPNGGIVGSIPKDWVVIAVRKDATGRWTRITSHFGDSVGTHARFGSAPLFRSGWVVSSSLENLGFHCQKPVSSLSINLQANQVGRSLKVQENWLSMGDRIAMSAKQQKYSG